MESADQSRRGNGRPGQEISDGQIDKALTSIREGISPAAACEEHGFTYSGLRRRCQAAPELAQLVEEAKRIGQGALERIIHDHARNGSPTEKRLLNKTSHTRKVNPRLLTRILQQHNPNWRPGSETRIAGSLTHQVKRNLAKAELETMLEALDEAYPGGIAAIAEHERLAEKLGTPAPRGHIPRKQRPRAGTSRTVPSPVRQRLCPRRGSRIMRAWTCPGRTVIPATSSASSGG